MAPAGLCRAAHLLDRGPCSGCHWPLRTQGEGVGVSAGWERRCCTLCWGPAWGPGFVAWRVSPWYQLLL